MTVFTMFSAVFSSKFFGVSSLLLFVDALNANYKSYVTTDCPLVTRFEVIMALILRYLLKV